MLTDFWNGLALHFHEEAGFARGSSRARFDFYTLNNAIIDHGSKGFMIHMTMASMELIKQQNLNSKSVDSRFVLDSIKSTQFVDDTNGLLGLEIHNG